MMKEQKYFILMSILFCCGCHAKYSDKVFKKSSHIKMIGNVNSLKVCCYSPGDSILDAYIRLKVDSVILNNYDFFQTRNTKQYSLLSCNDNDINSILSEITEKDIDGSDLCQVNAIKDHMNVVSYFLRFYTRSNLKEYEKKQRAAFRKLRRQAGTYAPNVKFPSENDYSQMYLVAKINHGLGTVFKIVKNKINTNDTSMRWK